MANLHDKTEYVVHIKKKLKQALSQESDLEILHRFIEFKQKTLLKSYIDVDTNLRK